MTSEYKMHFTPTIEKQHIGPNTLHRIYHFENGYGASVIPEYRYGSGLQKEVISDVWELAVIKQIAGL